MTVTRSAQRKLALFLSPGDDTVPLTEDPSSPILSTSQSVPGTPTADAENVINIAVEASPLHRLLHRFGLIEADADADGLYGKHPHRTVLPASQFQLIWRLSWLSLLSGIVALACRHFDLFWVPLGVWLTSINYWRHPDFSWRRYLDIVFVQVALWYQVYRAYGADNRDWYYSITGIGMCCYLVGVYCKQVHKSTWASTLCHCLVHILGNAANIALYVGHIPAVKGTATLSVDAIGVATTLLLAVLGVGEG